MGVDDLKRWRNSGLHYGCWEGDRLEAGRYEAERTDRIAHEG